LFVDQGFHQCVCIGSQGIDGGLELAEGNFTVVDLCNRLGAVLALRMLVTAGKRKRECRDARNTDRQPHSRSQYAVESRHTIATVLRRIEKSSASDQLRR